jgi:hypothetical protein
MNQTYHNTNINCQIMTSMRHGFSLSYQQKPHWHCSSYWFVHAVINHAPDDRAYNKSSSDCTRNMAHSSCTWEIMTQVSSNNAVMKTFETSNMKQLAICPVKCMSVQVWRCQQSNSYMEQHVFYYEQIFVMESFSNTSCQTIEDIDYSSIMGKRTPKIAKKRNIIGLLRHVT